MNNKLYFVVGLEGSGKTTATKLLADSVEGGVAVQTSSRLISFLEKENTSIKEINTLSTQQREEIINRFHYQLYYDKEINIFSFFDGHMFVDNIEKGIRIKAMATENRSVSDGLIFLNASSFQINKNITNDNINQIRCRNVKKINKLKELSEIEFQAAEDYCLKNKLDFGFLNSTDNNGEFASKRFSDITFLNHYLLPQNEELRDKYKDQFDFGLKPSCLRERHLDIGRLIEHSFHTKIDISKDNYQVISMDRSGNFIANGFVHNFDGQYSTYHQGCSAIDLVSMDKDLIIIDSVIDTGATIEDIVGRFPSNYNKQIHVICLCINIKSLPKLQALSNKVTFHCLGFSNKEDRPTGKKDMGARLYGTSS
ncbi:phosphoribosyltransferase [Vibrio parahaemolyticus]|nr:phosphoribosyltransferase [Vibrio parahaemolyticus]EHH2555739.1 phosphoribosyltransferase [Vibrio parahaemolyticus]EHV5555284.1 phosphoribosyltransferase [Vibrio parahaemolyticus]EJG0632315.1 phosphoribosyltransferase [Vibrio parahaemolyticus]EJG0737109.1 phosphoribosyltransferase [Vibrio parahaemolyticus]